ncbi:uncharacterized protein [Primulina huaijiensis]|uniref:uncharacterized protein isoform X3 n=1 Tax=Primulina huaijiensis TaxID=1492673 RepID=UPI003CC7010D
MGGENFLPPFSSTEDESSVGQDFSRVKSDCSSGEEGLNADRLNGESGLHFEEFSEVGYRNFSERQRCKAYADVLRSYEDLRSRLERFEEAKLKILSYTPGSWVENAGGMCLKDYSIPKITSLLLIGPKGSGKSSLVNKISGVLENSVFASERAQASCTNNSSRADGTYFLHEYIIPAGFGSFCLYDSRSLSDDSSENANVLEGWMTKGVHHGELVTRKSDSLYVKAQLKFKARQSCRGQVRAINFVIFVVDGISILEAMGSSDGTNNGYTHMTDTTFNNPFLSFKDDKPVVVITHGDLLSLSDRAKIRVHLGELLGVSPTKQIFDIPDDKDPATALTIIDMLHYCLDRADRNLPSNDLYMSKMYNTSLSVARRVLLVVLVMAILLQVLVSIIGGATKTKTTTPTSSKLDVDWHKIRYLWLGDDY